MADIYGIRITPDDGGKQIVLDGGSRFVSSLGNLQLNGTNRSRQVKAMTSGATPLVIPRNLVKTFIGSSTPVVYYVNGWSLSGSGNFTYSVGGTGGVESMQNNFAEVDVFSVDGGSSSGGQYGIRIRNSSDFLNLSDTTYLGFVTLRTVVNISNSWAIPSGISSLGSYVVFVRFEGGDRSLYLNRASNTIEVYGPGGVSGGTVNGVQIVIVSCGFSPGLPASGYGMVIRNAAGQITFSSKYPPVIWGGSGYSFSAYDNWDSSDGEVLQWTNPSGSVALPMIPLCSIGTQSGAKTRSDGTWNYRSIMYSGFKMTGNSVSCARGPGAGEVAITLSPKAMQVGCFIPCIDAVNYF